MRRDRSSDDQARLVRPGSVDAAGRLWPVGDATTVQWITDGLVSDGTITTAIPPLFAVYGTIVEPVHEGPVDITDHERALVEQLTKHGSAQWWLGYLDTGAHDVVFPRAARVSMYWDWSYVLVQAGPEEALTWRGMLPDLIFPLDRSWLLSMLWDDDWSCIGGPTTLVDALAADPLVNARRVERGDDPTPPGHHSG